MKIISFFIVIHYLLVSFGEGSRILAIFPIPVRSHQIFNQGIMRTLALAGHDVTILAPMTFWNNPTPNYHFIKINSYDTSISKYL